MKRIIPVLIMTVSLLLPKNAAASFDFLKDFLEIIGLSEEDITSAVNDYVEHEIDLQEKTTDTKNMKAAKKLAKSASKTYTAVKQARTGLDQFNYSEFLNSKLANWQWPGIDAATDAGEYTTPQTKKQVALAYFKKKHVRNDVQVNLAKDIAINNMAIANLSIDYANGLSTRYKLQQEMKQLANEEDPQGSGEDIQELEWNYGVVMRRANNRWLDILLFEATHLANVLKDQANSIRVDDMSEIIGEDVSDAVTELQSQGVRTPERGSNGLTVGQTAQAVERGINALRNKDYSSAFSSMSSLYGNTNPKVSETLNKISGNVSTGEGLYNDVSNGNYESSMSAAYDAGKKYYDQQKSASEAKGGNDNDKGK